MSALPRDWREVSLGELGKWIGGGTPSKANPLFWTKGTVPWVSPKDMKTPRIDDAKDHITNKAIEHSATNLIAAGSVLLVVRSGILKHTLPVAVTDRAVALNQDLKAVTPRKGINSEYLALALKAFERDILHTCTKNGVTVQSIILPSLLRFKIPIAPPKEQRRIVAEVDKCLTQLDAGIAAITRVQANLRRYRASVLKAACDGSLRTTETPPTRTEKAGTESGKELLSTILAQRRRRWSGRGRDKTSFASKARLPALPRDWTWATIGQLLTESPCNGISIKGSDSPPGVRALKLSAMSDRGFDYADIRYLPLADSDVDDLWIRKGDFFVCRGNGSIHLIGRGTVAQKSIRPTIFPDTMIRLRFAPQVRDSGWIRTIWQSPLVRDQIQHKAKTTAGIYKIAQPEVERLVVPLPPPSEQMRIVAEVERRMSIIEKLEAVAKANLQRATRLRQGVLQKAFRRTPLL